MSDNDTKDAYVKKIKAKMDEWKAEIDRLDAKARQKQADAQQSYREQIEDLKAKRADAERKLDKLKQAGSSAWQDLRAGVEAAAESVGEAIKSARSRF